MGLKLVKLIEHLDVPARVHDENRFSTVGDGGAVHNLGQLVIACHADADVPFRPEDVVP